jgi:hypothetical protein
MRRGRGARCGVNNSEGFPSRFVSRPAFGDFNRFNCFLRAEGLVTDGRASGAEGARKIDEAKVKRGEEDTG